MLSPLDPVSVFLRILGMVGGVPFSFTRLKTIVEENNEEISSRIRASKARLIWCYVSHTVVFVTLQSIAVLSAYQDFTVEQMTSFDPDKGVYPKYGLTNTDMLIYVGEVAILIFNTYFYIYVLYSSSEALDRLNSSINRIAQFLISPEELDHVANVNKRGFVYFFLVLVCTFPPCQILAYTSMFYFNEGMRLLPLIGWTIAMIPGFLMLLMSLPTSAGFLIYKQTFSTLTAMVRNYELQVTKFNDKSNYAQQITNSRGQSPSMNSTTNNVTNDMTTLENDDQEIRELLHLGNKVAEIVERLKVTFDSLLCLDSLVVILLSICNLYVFISQLLIMVLTTPLSPVFTICYGLSFGTVGILYIYKLVNLISVTAGLEMQIEKAWAALRYIPIHKNLDKGQLYELKSLRERFQYQMRKLVRPNGLFIMRKRLLVQIMSMVIGYFLVIIGFRTNEIKAFIAATPNNPVNSTLTI